MRLINADKIHPDVRTQHGALAISQGQLAYAETVNAIPIPEDATNGDVIKAVFPNIEREDNYGDADFYLLNGKSTYTPKLITFKSWWNAPYKTESEERNENND